MVSRPIEEVRGTTLRIERPKEVLPRSVAPALPFLAPGGPAVMEYAITMADGRPIARVSYVDGSQAVFDARTGQRATPVSEAHARSIVRDNIANATVPHTIPPQDTIVSARLFEAEDVPLEFRRPMPVWQVRLRDGTHVYVGRDTAAIEAVRTPFWRVFDLMWGLHIMDLQTREDTHHPLLIGFAALALANVVLGTVLLFRRSR
jgi:hypothetical protein